MSKITRIVIHLLLLIPIIVLSLIISPNSQGLPIPEGNALLSEPSGLQIGKYTVLVVMQ